jgi:hypothetical protein
MIYLAMEAVPEVVIAPGRRYAIVKVTNSTMTAHRGRWSWIAQEMRSRNRLSHMATRISELFFHRTNEGASLRSFPRAIGFTKSSLTVTGHWPSKTAKM